MHMVVWCDVRGGANEDFWSMTQCSSTELSKLLVGALELSASG